MAKRSEKTRVMDGLQGLVALIGITFGVIPLVRVGITGEFGGLFLRIFGPLAEALGYLAPLGVIIVAVGFIALFEAIKNRR